MDTSAWKNDNPVVSSHTWSEVLDIPLPDPLPWPLFELIHEDEFRKRIEKEVGSPNKQNKEEKNGK
jgi:hypothetical protein